MLTVKSDCPSMIIIGGKRVYVNENHHDSLLSWARERRRVSSPFPVITLDHHTDTLPAFTHQSEIAGKPFFVRADYRYDEEIAEALRYLRHDEHFDYALKMNIISRALLITHEDFSIEHDSRLLIVHDDPEDKSLTGLSAYYGSALESSFLQSNLEKSNHFIPEENFLLDIDLDYFKTEKSVCPKDNLVFYNLVRRASAVTICLERDWVRLLNMDFSRSLSSDYFLEKIVQMISLALGA